MWEWIKQFFKRTKHERRADSKGNTVRPPSKMDERYISDRQKKPKKVRQVPHYYPANTQQIRDPDGGKRPMEPVGIVIHHTATYKASSTVNYFKKNVVDVHFVIGHKGEVIQMIPCNRTAAHAGKSKWAGMTSLNNHFIGIEVVNIGYLSKKDGKYYDCYNREWKGEVRERKVFGQRYWEPFTIEQEYALRNLCGWLVDKYNIPVSNITAHYEVSPKRKIDPAGGMELTMDQFRESMLY